MFERWLGKKDDQEKSVPVVAVRPRDPARPAPSPASPDPGGSSPVADRPSVLRAADGGNVAETRARAAMAAPASATPAPRTIALPEDAGAREQAAAYFSVGEQKRAVDLLISHLNKTAGHAPKGIWFMLMDAYQALGQQAAFEKSACLFAEFFKTSPPSWISPEQAGATSTALGRNVLVVDGAPSGAHAEKLRDFLAAARSAGKGRLDLSRARLSEDHAQRSDDLKVLLDLMRRLRQRQVATLLMGENQLVEVLRGVIQQDIPVPQPELYWQLLLEFMQWRGQEDAYEDLAIAFAARFGRSAPGYEPAGVVAAPPVGETPAPADSLLPPPSIDGPTMEQWCTRILRSVPSGPSLENPLRLDFQGVHTVGFEAAGILASRLHEWAWNPAAIVVEGPSELVTALFDITGVTGQVHIVPRRR